mgnify:CR=1 FL=1
MDRLRGNLRDVVSALQERGVQTRAIWGLIHEQLPYRNEVAYRIEKALDYSSCILIACAILDTRPALLPHRRRQL